MKKGISVFIFFVLCLALFAGCGGKYKEFDNFGNIEDFSSIQGYKGWTYLFGDVAFQPTNMTFNEYKGAYNSTLATVSGAEWMPHQNEDIVLRFDPPKKGTVTITYSLWLIGVQLSTDDGVQFSIYDAAVDSPLAECSLVGNGKESRSEGELRCKISAGAPLYFVLNAGYGNENDLTHVDIAISY